MDQQAWSDLIGRRLGLVVREGQQPALADRVGERMQRRGVTCAASYFELLEGERDAGEEWTELVDGLVSHETSFFRHMPTFETLETVILPSLRNRPDVGANTLALCSAGCSTGEEAYSLAMTAMTSETDSGSFCVWGVDISRRAIAVARSARYRERATASVPSAYRERFLLPVAESSRREYAIAGELRDRVRFVVSNFYASGGMVLNYDVILCQNVLIYFAPAAVSRLVARLGARLNPGGYLLLGPGDAPGECPAGLEPVALPGVRVLRRVGRTVEEVP